jgi:hypothetical protein
VAGGAGWDGAGGRRDRGKTSEDDEAGGGSDGGMHEEEDEAVTCSP